MICPKCSRTSIRSKEFLDAAECQLCGTILHPLVIKEKPYNYICTECGYDWQSSDDRDKTCKCCGSVNIIISYKDGTQDLNMDSYQSIIKNHNEDKSYSYRCHECDGTKEILSPNLYNIICACGEIMEYVPDDIHELLKKCRKLHRQSQEQFAKELRISQQQYSKMERGLIPIPKAVISVITTKMND